MNDTLQTDFVNKHADVETTISLFDKWVARRMHDRQQPGLSAGIIHKGELIWAKGYGFADAEAKKPATPDTAYRIASISKTFTATAIMQLRDAGKLCLDDPLAGHLPWFDLQYPGAPPITLRHALTHTSGIPRDAATPMWTEGKVPSWQEVVETTKVREPVMPPVQEFKYSNLAYALLSGVVEAASGQAYADYIQANILDPLGMRDTLIAPTGDEAALATGYLRTDAQYARKPASFMDASGFTPAAGLASTVNDLAKYAAFHLSTEANGVLSPHTLRDMHRIHWLDPKWE
jgi:CubicO group peptidase (beta-lactamase class C family)